MGVIGGLLRSAAAWVGTAWNWAGSALGLSAYASIDPRRKILQAGLLQPSATANQALAASLPQLRSQCRQLERNNPSARAAVEGLVASVVGTGIALEPDTGDERINAAIRAEWNKLVQHVAVDGRSLYDLQALGFREIVTAGEALWRIVILPERLDDGHLPFAILPLEAEWLDAGPGLTTSIVVRHPDGSTDVGGVRVDAFGRPMAFRLVNPEWPVEPEWVDAKEIIHPYERRRPLQSRGEPWFSPVIETLMQERDLVDAELASAKNTASMAMVITSDHHDDLDTALYGSTDDPAQSVRLGGIARLYPGEDIKALAHERPSQQIAPFRQMLRGDLAGALRLPQRFFDRDVSRANYSSMKSDNIDSDRLLAPVREWFGHATAGAIYKAALPYLALKAGVRIPRPDYRLLPDGQPYIDPIKDGQGALQAIAGGLSTHEAEIAKRGGDYRQVWSQLAKEKALAQQLGLDLDLGQGIGADAEQDQEQGQEESAQGKAPVAKPVKGNK